MYSLQLLFFTHEAFAWYNLASDINKSDEEDAMKSLFIGGEDRYAFVMSQSEGLIQNAYWET